MKTITRIEAIDDIRRVMLTLVDDEHSMYQTASRLGIYCRGFKQYSDAELFEHYKRIVQRHGVTKREELARRYAMYASKEAGQPAKKHGVWPV